MCLMWDMWSLNEFACAHCGAPSHGVIVDELNRLSETAEENEDVEEHYTAESPVVTLDQSGVHNLGVQ